MINSPQGKKGIMKLAHRMVKNFCSMLSMSGKLDFPQLSEVNNSGVRVSVRKSLEPGQPSGMVVSAATSLWLPLPSPNVFNFLKDEKMRVQVIIYYHKQSFASNNFQKFNYHQLLKYTYRQISKMITKTYFWTNLKSLRDHF